MAATTAKATVLSTYSNADEAGGSIHFVSSYRPGSMKLRQVRVTGC